MPHVEAVAGARVVHVIGAVVWHEPVVGRIVETAEAQRRSALVAFRGVVVDDVEDHFETGAMQRLDHLAELHDDVARGRVARVFGVRREVADRVVTPVVAQAAIEQKPVMDEVMDRHQLDGRHAEILQRRDRRRMREAGIGAANLGRQLRVPLGEALDVDLVEDRLVQRVPRRRVAVPIEAPIGDDAARHERG